jgi:hypothetical protein
MEHSATSTLIRADPVDLHPDIAVSEVGSQRQIQPPRGSHTPRSILRRLASEGGAVYLVSFGLYVVVAVLLDFKYKSFNGDATSRMANGFYILYSRDPHLAAVGFVWTPLQSIADMVFLLGNHLWPALSHHDMAGSLVSALAMAGAVHQIRAALREWGINLVPRLLLTAFFALNPMILYYAGNGMSEGLYVFTLTTASRYLIRWMHTSDVRSLAYSATALGFSYLARNEAAAAMVFGAVAVFAVSYTRAAGSRRVKRAIGLADAAIFALPAFVAALGWAIASKVITGEYFGQFESIYGNSAQELLLKHKTFDGRIFYVIQAVASFWPLLPIVLLAAIILAVRRRDPRILAPLGILGGALAFDSLSLVSNSIENLFRYFIAAFPLEVLIVGSLVAAVPKFSTAPPATQTKRSPSRTGRRIWLGASAVGLIFILMIPSTVTTSAAMFDPNIGVQETQFLDFIFDKHVSGPALNTKTSYATIIAMGDYITSLHLPDGSVIVDNAALCVPDMITTVARPKVFVIPNDRDFQRTLADPLTFHAHYILEPNPTTTPISAPNIQFPKLWSTGAGFAKEVHDIPSKSGCPEFRLFKVLRHPSQALQ